MLFYILFNPHNIPDVEILYPHLHMRKQRLREILKYAQH